MMQRESPGTTLACSRVSFWYEATGWTESLLVNASATLLR